MRSERARLIVEEGLNVNENARRVLEAAGAQRDEAACGFRELSEHASFESEAFLRTIGPLRRFLGCGFASGGRRPAPEFYEVLLGYGRAGAEALLNAFLEDVPDPRSTALPLWRAVSAIGRAAHSRGFVGWDLDGWRPLGSDDSKARIVAYIPPELNEKTRRLAFESKATVSSVVEDALAAAVSLHEAQHGELAARVTA